MAIEGVSVVKGIFITAEGGEGAGKTTVLSEVADKLEATGCEVLLTREPGGIQISEEIRKVILDVNHQAMDERTEALLYAAARRQHLTEKVIPALQSGKVVLCDRFIDSSLAYQGHARGIGIEAVRAINTFAIEDLMPDLTLLFDIRPEKGMERIRANDAREVNRLDMEHQEFHEKVYECYHMLASASPERIKLIDAEQPVETVADTAFAYIEGFIKKGGMNK